MKLVRKARRKRVRQRSVEWIERDIPAMDEVEKIDEISSSLVQQVIFQPMQRSSFGRKVWYIIENKA